MKVPYPNSELLQQIIQQNKKLLLPVIGNPSKYKLQIIYTQIDRDKKNRPTFVNHFFEVNNQYFYPASTVKLPAAVLALEYINKLKSFGIDKHTTMHTSAIRPNEKSVTVDSSNEGNRPTVAHYIRKILLVSDNDAFNRLYEMIGQEEINNRLHQLGFSDAQIIHRLSISLSESENRTTNPIQFIDANRKVLYQQESKKSVLKYADRNDKVGVGYLTGGANGEKLVNEPLDFSKKNRWTLPAIHQMVQWIMFPESQPKNKRLNLTQEDYQFLKKYMSMMPQESLFPKYDTADYWPAYVKFLHYGSDKNAVMNPDLRIFNKVGDAYGFLIDGGYFADFKNGVEFILSATLYCNEDEILNDDKYDYDSIGFPFLKNLGQTIYNFELSRHRKHHPDLSAYKFAYGQ